MDSDAAMGAAVAWWATVVGWTGFIFWKTWTPRPWPPTPAGKDLAGHLLGFGVLGVLLGYALGSVGMREAQRMVGPAGLMALVMATMSEVGQYRVPGRGVQLADWVADIGGAAAGIAVAAWAIARRRTGGMG